MSSESDNDEMEVNSDSEMDDAEVRDRTALATRESSFFVHYSSRKPFKKVVFNQV